jgi:hypothetical protein
LAGSGAQAEHLLAREWKRKSKQHNITAIDKSTKNSCHARPWRIDDHKVFEIYAELDASNDAEIKRANH